MNSEEESPFEFVLQLLELQRMSQLSEKASVCHSWQPEHREPLEPDHKTFSGLFGAAETEQWESSSVCKMKPTAFTILPEWLAASALLEKG